MSLLFDTISLNPNALDSAMLQNFIEQIFSIKLFADNSAIFYETNG